MNTQLLGGEKKDFIVKLSCRSKPLTSTHKHLLQVSIPQDLEVLLAGVE